MDEQSLDQVEVQEQEQTGQEGEGTNPDHVELVVRLCIKAIQDSDVLDTLEEAVRTSKDLATVFGRFLVQMMGGVLEQIGDRYDMSPNIFLHPRDGVVVVLLDWLEEQLGLPPEFSDQVWPEILEMVKGLAQGQQSAGAQQAPQPSGGNPVPGASGPGVLPPSGIEQVGLG